MDNTQLTGETFESKPTDDTFRPLSYCFRMDYESLTGIHSPSMLELRMAPFTAAQTKLRTTCK